jgi:hypothetical protein
MKNTSHRVATGLALLAAPGLLALGALNVNEAISAAAHPGAISAPVNSAAVATR